VGAPAANSNSGPSSAATAPPLPTLSPQGGEGFAAHRAKRSAADWLGLTATPTFALMALGTAVLGGRAPDVLCSVPHAGFALGGMIPMYVLMSAFHAGPWLKLAAGRR